MNTIHTTFSIREKSVEALGKEYPDYFIKKVSIESQKNLERAKIETVLEKAESHPAIEIGKDLPNRLTGDAEQHILSNLTQATREQAQVFLETFCDQLIAKGDLDKAMKLLSKAISFFPQNPMLLLKMANLKISQQKFNEAKGYLQKANILDKENKKVWISIVTLLVSIKNKSQLRMVLNEIFKQHWQIRELMILTEVLRNGPYQEELRCFVNRVEKQANESANDLNFFRIDQSDINAETQFAQVQNWLKSFQKVKE